MDPKKPLGSESASGLAERSGSADVPQAATSEKVSDCKNVETSANVSASPGRIRPKKWPIVVGTIALVLVVAGMGFWVWHEQPGFCGAICHTPMDPYVETYEQDLGVAGTDKWGNDVADTSSMLAVSHKADGQTCLSCHVPTIGEQVVEGLSWVGGGYDLPLQEATLEDLTAARGLEPDTFCLNESCHNLTRDDLAKATASMVRNPHLPYHGDIDCGTCHKAHRASVNYCTTCHTDAETPAGWLTAKEDAALPTS